MTDSEVLDELSTVSRGLDFILTSLNNRCAFNYNDFGANEIVSLYYFCLVLLCFSKS